MLEYILNKFIRYSAFILLKLVSKEAGGNRTLLVTNSIEVISKSQNQNISKRF